MDFATLQDHGLITALLCIAAYLGGSISSAILVCQLFGLPDPRTQGSNNPGATNVLRLGGKPAVLVRLEFEEQAVEARFRFDRRDRAWPPRRDVAGRTSVPGVYIAGDSAGIAGADAAERSSPSCSDSASSRLMMKWPFAVSW